MHLEEVIEKLEIDYHREIKRIQFLLEEQPNSNEIMLSRRRINILFKEAFPYLNFVGFVHYNDFLSTLGLNSIEKNCDFKMLLLYLETILTLLQRTCNLFAISEPEHNKINQIYQHILTLLDKVNCDEFYNEDTAFSYIIEKNKSTTEAIESTEDEQLALELLEYNRVLLEGNLEEKRKILYSLSQYIEPILNGKKLDSTPYASLKKDLGFYLNNFHIRHNNKVGKDKKEFIINMSDEDLETCYDEIYTSIVMLMIADKQVDISKRLNAYKQAN